MGEKWGARPEASPQRSLIGSGPLQQGGSGYIYIYLSSHYILTRNISNVRSGTMRNNAAPVGNIVL